MSVVKVLIFSVVAERIGSREVEIEIDLPTTAAEVLAALAARYPIVREMQSVARIAINLEYATMNSIVSNGDEVALITPTSGG